MKNINIPKWIIITLIAVFILRIPTFFDPFNYGDEMIYLTLGNGIRQGVTLYSGLHDNKPPLLYLMAAISGNVFWFRVILAFWNMTTILMFWKLAERLCKNNSRVVIISTLVFAILTTLPLFEGNIANAELFMILPTLAAFYLLLSDKMKASYLFLAGVLFAIAVLFKVPAVFDLCAIFVFWLIKSGINLKNLKRLFSRALLLGLGFGVTIGTTFLWYYLAGALKEYTIAAFLQNVGYLSSWRPDDAKLPFYVKNGPLLIRFGIVLFGSFVLYIKRKSLSNEFIFITLWLLFSLFGVTLSERPYPHYIIQVVPAISLLVGLLFASKKMDQIYAIVPLGLAAFTFAYFNFWHYPTLPYYTNFIKFSTGVINKEEYFNHFNGYANRNYEIAKVINSITTKRDKVFVWGSDGSIYAISRRLPPVKYVADYHIKDFYSKDKLLEELGKTLPKVIVVLPEAEELPLLDNLFAEKYILYANIENASIWKRTN